MQVVKFMVLLLPRKFLSKTCSLERSEQASMITSSQEVDLHCRFQGKRGFDAVTRRGSSPISTNGNEMKMSHGWILHYHGDLSPWICSRILCLVLIMANNATMMRAIISPWAASEDKYLGRNKKSDRLAVVAPQLTLVQSQSMQKLHRNPFRVCTFEILG